MTESRRSTAVIGAGVAGLPAAHLLQRRYDVTLFEADHRLGGRPPHERLPPRRPATSATSRPTSPPSARSPVGISSEGAGGYRWFLAGTLHTRRMTFVIDPDRSVRHVVADERSMHAHADAALEALRREEAA